MWSAKKRPGAGLPADEPRKVLEAHAQTKLNLAHKGVVARDRARQGSETSGIAGVEVITAGIAKLIVVEYVGEHELELGVEPLGDP